MPARNHSAASVTAAYAFLAERLGQYGTGSALGVPQSYTGGYLGSIGFVSSFAYDNAATILAWLAEGTRAGIGRARALGDALAVRTAA